MDTLGTRIRRLRKDKQMTLEQVAAGKLTKGMLSLIENGKAHPSMENLHHIALQLGVDVSDLIGNQNREEIRAILNKAEVLWEKINSPQEGKPLLDLIDPIVDSLPDTYEGARLLEFYGKIHLLHENEEMLTHLEKAEHIYKKLHLHNEVVNIQIFRSELHFLKHAFDEALSDILKVRKEIEVNDWHLNKMTKIELDYIEAAYYYAVGDYEEGAKITKKALDYMNETHIYHIARELYVLAIVEATMNGNEERWNYYMRKLKQFAEFTENPTFTLHAEILTIHYFCQYKQQYEDVLKMIENIKLTTSEAELFKNFIRLEEGIALFGLKKYEEALSKIQQCKIDTILPHPLDLSNQYRKFTFQALCYLELGNLKMAQKEINTAVELFSKMPPTPEKQFTMETYEKIKKASRYDN